MKTIALTLIAAGLGLAQNAQNQNGAQSQPQSNQAQSKKPAQPAAKTASHTAAPVRAATTPKSKTPLPQKPAATAKAQEPVSAIPQGATLVEPNLYRYTDSSGKMWMYRQTPFGISKYEDVPAPAQPAPAAAGERVAVTDLGDSVRFEKKTAFGPSQWVRKKSELTEDEKALLAGSQGVAGATEKKTPERP